MNSTVNEDKDGQHVMSIREEEILKAWKRGERSPEEICEITGYSMKEIGLYLPLGTEREYK